MHKKNRVLRVAEAVADGKSVDWGSETSGDAPAEIIRLHEIARIGEVHRDLSEPSWIEATQPLPRRQAIDVEPVGSWGRISLVEEIGRGATGQVFRGYDPVLQQDVAVKLLHDDSRSKISDRKFLAEVRSLARVRHPNVLRILGADEHDGRVGLWTELIEGESLHERLRKHGLLGSAEAALLGRDLCLALAAVHALGLVHGDLKTANVMREEGGRIVLMDFGAVVDVAKDPPHSLSGTPLYLAPERFRGGAPSPASDQYALGVLLYRMVSGSFPVQAEGFEELTRMHREGERTLLRDRCPHLPGSFLDVVDRALSPDPEDRFESLGEMERALALTIGSPSVPIQPASPGKVLRRTIVGVAAMLIVALGIWQISALFGSFSVEASLFRRDEAGDVRLRQGSRVQTGDRVFLEIAGTDDFHLYVLNQDDAGNAFVLFPLRDIEVSNPIGSDRLVRVPGPESYWDLTTSGGGETLLVVAAKQPVDVLEEALSAAPEVGRGLTIPLRDPDLLPAVRGFGGLSTEDPESPLAGSVDELFSELSMRSSKRSDVWVWEIRLAPGGGP